MARFDLQKDDLIGEFLPDVIIKRITLEDYNDGDNKGAHIEIDLQVRDVMDKEVRRLASQVPVSLARRVNENLRGAGQGGWGGSGQAARSDEELIDSALKVGLIITTSRDTDGIIKALLRLRGGRSRNWKDRWNESVLNVQSGMPIENPSIGQVLRNLNVGDFVMGPEHNAYFLEASARTLNSEQYTDAAYELMGVRDLNNNINYVLPHTFKQVLSKLEQKWISVFTFTFMDFSVFELDISAEELAFLNNLYGTVRYVKVLESGKIQPTSRIFLDNAGTPWIGPYHQMTATGRFMKRRFHNSNLTDPSQYLTPIMVPNYKVQDFRSFARAEKDNYLPASMPSFLQKNLELEFLQKKKTNQLNSRIDLTAGTGFGDFGHIMMEILIDQENILENYSKFSNIYKTLKKSMASNVVRFDLLKPGNSFRLVSARIKRRRITRRNTGITSLGLPGPDLFDREEPDFIVAETGEPPAISLLPSKDSEFSAENLMVPLVTSVGEISDDDFRVINEGLSLPGMASFIEGSQAEIPLDNFGNLPFPFFRKILVTDKSLVNIHEGIYQYGIELVYEDPIEKLLKNMLVSLKDARQQLQEYYNESTIPVFSVKFRMSISEGFPPEIPLERGSYNMVTKSFEQSFVERANEKYDFEMIASAYVEAFGLVIADASYRIGNLPASLGGAGIGADGIEDARNIEIGNIRRIIQPENSRPEQILLVLNSYIELEGLLEDLVDVDLIKDASNIQLTPAQAGSSGRAPHLIKVERWFSGANKYANARQKLELNMRFMPPPIPPESPPEQLDEYEEIFELEGKEGAFLRMRNRTSEHFRATNPSPAGRQEIELELAKAIREIQSFERAGSRNMSALRMRVYFEFLESREFI